MPAIEPDLFHQISPHEKEYVEFLNTLFYEGAKRRAADVHLLWEARETKINFGIAGTLEHYRTVPNDFAKYLDDKLRARANIPASERHRPQDSRFQLRYPDRTLDCRVSVAPTITGQKIVCRINDDSVSVAKLDDIWMPPLIRQTLLDILVEPQGLFLVCGPTGSGKTTTLYAGIDYLHDGTRNIITIEHPVEKIIPGITQFNVDVHMTFARALETALRQAPKVILIGEIRSPETAEIAIRAANTGHIVLATVHANNAPAAVTRMLELGIDPKSLASTLLGVLSQRLVRTLKANPERATREPSEVEIEWMEAAGIYYQGLRFPATVTNDDYEGVMPVMEILKADDHVRSAILEMGGEMPIFNAAMRQPQFETMAQASTRLAASGVTTLELAMKLDRESPIAPETKRLGQVLVELGFAERDQVFAAAEHQMALRKKGKRRRIGQILVERGICTTREIIEAVGFTEGAPELIKHFVLSGRISQTLAGEVEGRWRRDHAGQSLFHLYIELNHLSKEDFDEPSLLQFTGRRLAHVAHDHDGAGNGSVGADAAVAV